MLEFRVVGYLRRMASRLIEARVSEYVDMAEKTISGALKTYIRKEIVDGVNWKSLLHGLVMDLDPLKAYHVLDGLAFYFVHGKSIDPRYLKKGNEEDLEDLSEEDLEDLSEEEKAVEEGKVDRNFIEETAHKVIGAVVEILKRKRLVEDPGELMGLAKKLVLRGDLSKEEQGILDKVEKEISTVLLVNVKDTLRREKSNSLTKLKKEAPPSVLDPDKAREEGVGLEKMDPIWESILHERGIDLDEIQKYVESFPPPKGKAYKIILMNILGDPPYGSMSQEELEEELGKDQTTVSRLQKELLGIIKDRFFKGVSRKEKVDIGKAGIKDLNKDQLDDFLEFLGDELKGSKFERVKRIVHGLNKNKSLKDIASEEGINSNTVNSDVSRDIKPLFEAWKKEQEKMASVSDIIHKVYAARRNKRQREFEQTFKGMPPGPTPEERLKERGVKELEEKYKGLPEETVRGPSVPEDDMAAILEQAAGDKEKMKDKIKGQFEKRIIKPRYFIATVEFSSKYDWADIGHGKFHPEKDAEGKWTSDDPEFKWVGYKVSVDKTLHVGKRSTKIVYNMDAKLKASGELEGGVTSRLRIVDQSADGDKVVIDDHGKSGYSSVVDEMFLDLVREHGVIMTGRVGIPQEYHNVHLKRDYNNVGDFEAEYGGIGFSDPKHREKAEEYREFVKKREEHQMGHQKDLLDDAPTLISRLTFFVKKPHIQPLDKNMAKEYIKELKGKPSKEKMVEVSKFLESHDRAEMERMKQVEIF